MLYKARNEKSTVVVVVVQGSFVVVVGIRHFDSGIVILQSFEPSKHGLKREGIPDQQTLKTLFWVLGL